MCPTLNIKAFLSYNRPAVRRYKRGLVSCYRCSHYCYMLPAAISSESNDGYVNRSAVISGRKGSRSIVIILWSFNGPLALFWAAIILQQVCRLSWSRSVSSSLKMSLKFARIPTPSGALMANFTCAHVSVVSNLRVTVVNSQLMSSTPLIGC